MNDKFVMPEGFSTPSDFFNSLQGKTYEEAFKAIIERLNNLEIIVERITKKVRVDTPEFEI